MSNCRVSALAQLLPSLFSDLHALRRFIRQGPEGHSIMDESMPGADTPPLRQATKAVTAWGSRGLIDAALFDRLAAARPGRASRGSCDGHPPASG